MGHLPGRLEERHQGHGLDAMHFFVSNLVALRLTCV